MPKRWLCKRNAGEQHGSDAQDQQRDVRRANGARYDARRTLRRETRRRQGRRRWSAPGKQVRRDRRDRDRSRDPKKKRRRDVHRASARVRAAATVPAPATRRTTREAGSDVTAWVNVSPSPRQALASEARHSANVDMYAARASPTNGRAIASSSGSTASIARPGGSSSSSATT